MLVLPRDTSLVYRHGVPINLGKLQGFPTQKFMLLVWVPRPMLNNNVEYKCKEFVAKLASIGNLHQQMHMGKL